MTAASVQFAEILHALEGLGLPDSRIEKLAGLSGGFLNRARRGERWHSRAEESWSRLVLLLEAKGIARRKGWPTPSSKLLPAVNEARPAKGRARGTTALSVAERLDEVDPNLRANLRAWAASVAADEAEKRALVDAVRLKLGLTETEVPFEEFCAAIDEIGTACELLGQVETAGGDGPRVLCQRAIKAIPIPRLRFKLQLELEAARGRGSVQPTEPVTG